jgi:hypothetical protein
MVFGPLAAGAAGIGGLVYSAPSIVAYIIGMGATGPIAGGLLAGAQASAAAGLAGGGLAAGGFWATLQGFAMTSVGVFPVSVGALVGGLGASLSWIFL